MDIDVTANDTFDFYGNGSPEAVDDTTLEIISPPSKGTAVLNGTKITYTPNAGLTSGTTDTFSYRVKNKGGAWSAPATVTVTIASTPAAGDVSATTAQDSPITINVLANTVDPDNSLDPSTTVITTNPSYGSVTNNGDGTVVYTPNSGFLGSDSFGFKVSNNVGQSDEGTVTVTVEAIAPASKSGTFEAGNKAINAGKNSGGGLTATEVGEDEHVTRQCVGGCFDFKVTGLSAGGTAVVVLPLTEAIPDVEDPLSVQYRKLIDGKWVAFTPTTDDKVESAPGQAGQCPPPGDGSYGTMTAGHYCLQLTIKDGGPNDADGVENGTVVDPGGIAVRDMYATATSGCTIARSPADPLKHAEWWLLGGLLALLGLQRRKA